MYANKAQWYQALEETLGLEPADLDDLAGILTETLPEAIGILDKAVAPKDELRRQAHSIKGSSGNLGLLALSHLADELETLVLKDCINSPEYRAKLQELQAEYNSFVRLMQS